MKHERHQTQEQNAARSHDGENRILTRSVSKKMATTVYITEEQQALLKELSLRTRVPVAEYIREGINLVLKNYRAELSEQLELRSDVDDLRSR